MDKRTKSNSDDDSTAEPTSEDEDLLELKGKNKNPQFICKCIIMMKEERVKYHNYKSMHSAFVISLTTRKIISKGMNSGRTTFPGSEYAIHAEMEAIKNINNSKSRTKIKFKTYDLIVIRVTNSGRLGNSRPCSKCKKYIMNYCDKTHIKINTIYYSNEDGTITAEKFDKMENNLESGRFRKKPRKTI